MAETKIQWAHYTFNPWRGCTKISKGCAHCYAEAGSRRNPKVLGTWGDYGVRVIGANSYWDLPLRWNAEALRSGERRRVFCASLADVFEDRLELEEPRSRLFDLIVQCRQLDWLLLTKRPAMASVVYPYHCELAFNKAVRLGQPVDHTGPYLPNVWLGASVEDQENADYRVPELLNIDAAGHFLSCEPLLDRVDLRHVNYGNVEIDTLNGGRINWVIVGGESGHIARGFDFAWAASLRDQCAAAGVPFFLKQVGRHPRSSRLEDALSHPYPAKSITDPKGGNPDEWPPDLRIRQIPVWFARDEATNAKRSVAEIP